MWLMLTVAVGAALFMLKYKVQDLENELVGKQQQIVRDQSAIRVLQAEWTYLNDPGRLRRLSEEYLDFHAATPQNVSGIDALPFRNGGAPQLDATVRAPETHAEIAAPAFVPVAAPERPSVVSVAFARLQRLLLPSAAGAATINSEQPK
jgi:hypothetical protein